MSKADGPRVRQLITDYAADARVVALATAAPSAAPHRRRHIGVSYQPRSLPAAGKERG